MIELRYPALQADSLPAEPQGKPKETRSGAAIQLCFNQKASLKDLVQNKKTTKQKIVKYVMHNVVHCLYAETIILPIAVLNTVCY